MKQAELERLLMQPDGLETLRARAKDIAGKYGVPEAHARPVEAVAAAQPAPNEKRPTEQETSANDSVCAAATGDEGASHPGERSTRHVLSATVFTDDHFKGRGYAFSLSGANSVYRQVRGATLQHASVHDAISSAQLLCTADEIRGHLVLFQDDRFFGRYAKFDVAPVQTPPPVHNGNTQVAYIGNFINDLTSSILLIRRFPGEIPPIALGASGLRDKIRNYAASIPRVSPRGNPIVTWDMWPEGGDGHPNDPSKQFVHIKIPVRIDVPNWFDYDAEIRYWIYLYIDSAGSLQGYVANYGAWVDSGAKSGEIFDRIMKELPSTCDSINEALKQSLAVATPFGPYKLLYYLPGSFGATGNTIDDVELVLVRR